MVRNVHERELPAPAEQVWELVDSLGRPGDRLWPAGWSPMTLDRPLGPGAAGGHGGLRYAVSRHEPGRLVQFTAAPGQGLDGTHAFVVEPRGPGRCVLRHDLRLRTSGAMRLLWPLAVRPLHDAVLEDLLDTAERALDTGPARPARWSPLVRVLRRAAERTRATAVPVPDTALLRGVLPRIDAADAYAVPAPDDAPADPQAWADAVFRRVPGWVAALLALRQALVGFVGIERADRSAFDTLRRTDDEVLLGTDAGHLDFRASVLREPGRVVLSTVVRIRGGRGRLYWGVVRHLHPLVVRSMLAAAARRLSSGAPARSMTTGGRAYPG
ncbi:DUF2867 domain-containing protein [Pseudonocardia halophobica]|uniref:DUF2867 domain-containing protein n=1 Tax=Pseudonocardia halophobica TaxID=29401 RepID=UPI003D8D5BCE